MDLKISCFRKLISKHINCWKDERDKNKISISLHDVIMSGFACMFYQSASLLQFHQEFGHENKIKNVKAQFGVKNIPSATQMRTILDDVASNKFASVFNGVYNQLNQSGVIELFRNQLNTFFLSADGTQYYHSTKVRCKKCLVKNCKDGKHYSHQMLQSAIVLPGCKTVLPMMPTEISNTIDASKQDCEWKGFFRHLQVLSSMDLQLPFTIVLDSLFADQVVIKAIREHQHDFIIVSKPSDNKYVHEEFNLVTTKKTTQEHNDGKYLHCYQWSNNLDFNSSGKVKVNLLHYQMKSYDKLTKQWKPVYSCSWLTSHTITADNVADLALGGRSRWKIENECFNTVKNQGYNLEHNYGHGEKNLSFNFIILTMLAFLLHQLLEYKSLLYQRCRKLCGSKINLWNMLRSNITILVFSSFDLLLDFMCDPNKYKIPYTVDPPISESV